jgi:hypothetical protein
MTSPSGNDRRALAPAAKPGHTQPQPTPGPPRAESDLPHGRAPYLAPVAFGAGSVARRPPAAPGSDRRPGRAAQGDRAARDPLLARHRRRLRQAVDCRLDRRRRGRGLSRRSRRRGHLRGARCLGRCFESCGLFVGRFHGGVLAGWLRPLSGSTDGPPDTGGAAAGLLRARKIGPACGAGRRPFRAVKTCGRPYGRLQESYRSKPLTVERPRVLGKIPFPRAEPSPVSRCRKGRPCPVGPTPTTSPGGSTAPT